MQNNTSGNFGSQNQAAGSGGSAATNQGASNQSSASSTAEVPLSIPRRTMDIEDYLDVLRRHRSWILAPIFFGLVIGVVTAYLWPDSYLSSGTIRVMPPVVPSRLVQANVSQEMTQRINQLYQEIVSRHQLIDLIQTYNLYPSQRKGLPIEDVVEDMRKDINITQPRGLSNRGDRSGGAAFTISFTYSDRRLTQRVTQELISKFMSEASSSRTKQSVLTTQFLRDQVEMAKKDMDEIENKITALRLSNRAQLPEQEQVMVGRITALESGIQNLNMSLSRVGQDKIQLETQLRIITDQMNSLRTTPAESQFAIAQSLAAGVRSPELAELDRDILRLDAGLSALKENYKENHPDVQRMASTLNAKRRQREQLAASLEAAAASGQMATGVTPGGRSARGTELRDLQAAKARVESAIQAKEMEAEDLRRQIADTQNRIKALQAKLESSPALQQEYLQLLRDRELVRERYESVNSKLRDSSMATELEQRNQGETLELLEAANMPTDPYAPRREFIVIAGLLAGIVLGVTMAGVREMKDSSLKNMKDVRAYTKLTVLGSIPLLENDFVVRRRRRLGWLAWSAAILLGLLMMSGSIIYYYTSKT